MKKIAILGMIVLFSIFLANNVSAGCCVIQNSECTYWNMDDWDDGEEFCGKLDDWGYALNTSWHDVENCNIFDKDLPVGCQEGFSIPEFNGLTAGVALIGAGLGFILLRKKR